MSCAPSEVLHRGLVWIDELAIELWDGGADEREPSGAADGWSTESVLLHLPDSDECVVQVDVVTEDFPVPQDALWRVLDPPADRARLRLTDGWLGIGHLDTLATRLRLHHSGWTTSSPQVDLRLLASEDSRTAWLVLPLGTRIVEVDDATRDLGRDHLVESPPPGWPPPTLYAPAPEGDDAILRDRTDGSMWVVSQARRDALERQAYYDDPREPRLEWVAWVRPGET